MNHTYPFDGVNRTVSFCRATTTAVSTTIVAGKESSSVEFSGMVAGVCLGVAALAAVAFVLHARSRRRSGTNGSNVERPLAGFTKASIMRRHEEAEDSTADGMILLDQLNGTAKHVVAQARTEMPVFDVTIADTTVDDIVLRDHRFECSSDKLSVQPESIAVDSFLTTSPTKTSEHHYEYSEALGAVKQPEVAHPQKTSSKVAMQYRDGETPPGASVEYSVFGSPSSGADYGPRDAENMYEYSDVSSNVGAPTMCGTAEGLCSALGVDGQSKFGRKAMATEAEDECSAVTSRMSAPAIGIAAGRRGNTVVVDGQYEVPLADEAAGNLYDDKVAAVLAGDGVATARRGHEVSLPESEPLKAVAVSTEKTHIACTKSGSAGTMGFIESDGYVVPFEGQHVYESINYDEVGSVDLRTDAGR